jgi:hypothetical protein
MDFLADKINFWGDNVINFLFSIKNDRLLETLLSFLNIKMEIQIKLNFHN